MRAFRFIAVSVVALSLSLPTGVAAADPDGEVLDTGTNIAGEVYLPDGSGRPRVNFANIGNCAVGLQCWVEVKWHYQCVEVWCIGYTATGSQQIPQGQDYARAPYCVDGGNKWEAFVRLHWIASQTRTVETWGNFEFPPRATRR